MSEINLKMTFSGLGESDNDCYHDTKQKVNFLYAFPVYQMKDRAGGNPIYYSSSGDNAFSYQEIQAQIENLGLKTFALWRYQEDSKYQLEGNKVGAGVSPLVDMLAEPRSFYRREVDPSTGYYGEWEPVSVQTDKAYFYDYNISNGRKYEYVSYPKDAGQTRASYANRRETNDGETIITPIETRWQYWSLAELMPAPIPLKTPTVKKAYTVDKNNMWLFKYNINIGAQTQNVSKTEQQTLGKYPKFSHGLKNNISGTVECYLGSEITKCGGEYIERMRQLQYGGAPLSTNEKTKMLLEWRKLIYSKNPKLLRDVKGQKWIVQVHSSSNNVQTNWKNQPDIISFSWNEIENTDYVTIVGEM